MLYITAALSCVVAGVLYCLVNFGGVVRPIILLQNEMENADSLFLFVECFEFEYPVVFKEPVCFKSLLFSSSFPSFFFLLFPSNYIV